LVQNLLAATADVDMRSMRGEADSHLLAETGSPAGDQNAFALQEGGVEHGVFPSTADLSR
jgi:hypothetical protein